MRTPTLEQQAQALDEGRAHAELEDVRLTLVSGADARAWLHDLVTTDVASLGRFETRPSLLLTPTGRIRAAFHVIGDRGDAFLLAQSSDQPEPIAGLLAPYVLSSDVSIQPVPFRIFAVPGRAEAPAWVTAAHRPSVLGGGFDVVAGDDDQPFATVRGALAGERLEPSPLAAVEARRISRAVPRFPVDLDQASLPAEAGWDVPPVTDRAKGCFLGQEAVAKVSGLGHPTRLVAAVRGDSSLRASEAILADGTEVGLLTSVDGPLGFARIRWVARDASWVTVSGTPLARR